MEHQISASAEKFLNLIRSARRGKLKIYLGMAAGVGKTYRMLLDAKELHRQNVDVFIGYIETHGRVETEAMMQNLPFINRRKVFYKGKQLEEMDVDAVIMQKPVVVIVDELAHTNIPGSKNEKRWQDVREILDAGINVISAVNIQHIESINEQVEKITGIKISERVPDALFQMADEVVNVDLTIEELLVRMKEGKIYDPGKVSTALANFFQKEKLLPLRDLAIKEVSRLVERKMQLEIPVEQREKLQTIVTVISSEADKGKRLIRKSSRLSSVYRSKWYVVYVQTARETVEKINPLAQRHLINNFKLATELGAEVVELKENDAAGALLAFAQKCEAALMIIGMPDFSFWGNFTEKREFRQLMKAIAHLNIDILMVTPYEIDKK